jgi:DnaK suppressor protein
VDTKDLAQFKKLLTEQLVELNRAGNCDLEGLKNSHDTLPDVIDQASDLMERNLSHQVCDRRKRMKTRLEQSLNDIETGEYGICKHCEEDIPVKRLMSNPVAQLCIDCKSELENRDRASAFAY